MRAPTATYRLQLNATFTLEDVTRLVTYLDTLGVGDVYLSPVLEAHPGSTHGYDVTDPTTVRRDIGGEPALHALGARLRRSGMGLLLDIVPNHMAASTRNPWWADLLEFGADSPYAHWFDLGWRSVDHGDKLHLPILGSEWHEALEHGEISLTLDDAGLAFCYYEHRIPLAAATYATAIGINAAPDHTAPEAAFQEAWRSVMTALAAAAASISLSEPGRPERRDRARDARDRFLALCRDVPAFRAWVEQRLAAVDELPVAQRRQRFEQLLELQPYRLRSWRTATREITYRRFFDITELVGVRVEEPEVFEATHARFREWARAGDLTGLRIDHIDGLFDPETYLQRLRSIGPLYTVVEKILAHDERMRAEWDAEGTTGYDFLNVLNGWFIEPRGFQRMVELHNTVVAGDLDFAEIAYSRKKLALHSLFSGELAALSRELRALLPAGAPECDQVARALLEVTSCLGVYRTYASHRGLAAEDRARIERAIADARRRAPELPATAIDTLRGILLLDDAQLVPGARPAALRFVMHWQQLSGPAMAKGIEDTALYNYFPLTSANEVGGDPGDPATSTTSLHAFLATRALCTPATMNATSTHDTKRGEDVRARLNVLSELPDEWAALLDLRARALEAPETGGEAVPSPTDDLLLLQTLLGTWPVHGPVDERYGTRIRQYMIKAARESRNATSWRQPDALYEQALAARVTAWLRGDDSHGVHDSIDRLAHRLAYPGALNALAQVLLKTTAPGAPDFYQGNELWCLSLVDPDNRRPVDFAVRETALNQLLPIVRSPSPQRVAELRENWPDGRIKLFVTAAALHHRRAHRDIFRLGDYQQVSVTGAQADRVAAFSRRYGAGWSLTVTARWLAAALPRPGAGVPPDFWASSALRLAPGSPRRWTNVLTGEAVEAGDDHSLALSHVFATLPSAVLYAAT